LKVFPNPFQNQLTIEATKNTNLSILDQNGLLIFDSVIDRDGEYKINTSAFAPGVYLIQLSNKDGNKKIRAVKLE
jgi:Secretion system C-terminal sorting domain